MESAEEPIEVVPEHWEGKRGHKYRVKTVWMVHCLTCGKPIYYQAKKSGRHRSYCQSKPGHLPLTCRGIGRLTTMGMAVPKYGLYKTIKKMAGEGFAFIADPGEVPPIIRESY